MGKHLHGQVNDERARDSKNIRHPLKYLDNERRGEQLVDQDTYAITADTSHGESKKAISNISRIFSNYCNGEGKDPYNENAN